MRLDFPALSALFSYFFFQLFNLKFATIALVYPLLADGDGRFRNLLLPLHGNGLQLEMPAAEE